MSFITISDMGCPTIGNEAIGSVFWVSSCEEGSPTSMQGPAGLSDWESRRGHDLARLLALEDVGVDSPPFFVELAASAAV